jgi:hypothetical protein
MRKLLKNIMIARAGKNQDIKIHRAGPSFHVFLPERDPDYLEYMNARFEIPKWIARFLEIIRFI